VRALERLIAVERRLNPPAIQEIVILGGPPGSDDGDPTLAAAGDMRWERAPAEPFAAFRARTRAAVEAMQAARTKERLDGSIYRIGPRSLRRRVTRCWPTRQVSPFAPARAWQPLPPVTLLKGNHAAANSCSPPYHWVRSGGSSRLNVAAISRACEAA
jgi:hypothetical protein